jgi:hypothetical protein
LTPGKVQGSSGTVSSAISTMSKITIFELGSKSGEVCSKKARGRGHVNGHFVSANIRRPPQSRSAAHGRTRRDCATLLWVVLRDADNVNGYRFDANLWDPSSRPTRSRTPRWPSRLLRNALAIGLIARARVIPRGNQFCVGRYSMFFRGAPNAEDS